MEGIAQEFRTNHDKLWCAAAIGPDGKRHWGLGRTAGEAKASAWAYSHWPGGTGSVRVTVSSEVPAYTDSNPVSRYEFNSLKIE